MSKKWFDKPKYSNTKYSEKTELPSGRWVKCVKCGEVLLKKYLQENLSMCKCGFHFRINSKERIAMLSDEGSFKEHFKEISSTDPLNFIDATGNYLQKINQNIKKSGMNEGVVVGTAKINEKPVVLAIMEFSFLAGSMGSAIGEKIYQAMLLAIKTKSPLITVSCSGGARMQEGILSLMQMAKTCAGLEQMREKKIPYISIITDPTTGGITASFASLGDVIIAEPGALIAFAGPRVIEQTIRQKLPEGFQRSEFLQDHGFVDVIASRDKLKETVSTVLNFFAN